MKRKLLRGVAAAALLLATRQDAHADSDLSFSPALGTNVAITGNATPASVSGALSTAAPAATKLRVFNSGTVFAYFRCTPGSSPTATSGDTPLAAGASIIIDGNADAACAVLSSAATAVTLYFQWGEGGL